MSAVSYLSSDDTMSDTPLLYELALSIGTSLRLEENTRAFLETLALRRRLDFTAIWLSTGDGLRLSDSFPALPTHARDNQKAAATVVRAEPPYVVWAAGDCDFETLAGDSDDHPSSVAIFPMECGALEVHTAAGSEPWSEPELRRLMKVVAKLDVSIRGCLAYERAAEEVASRAPAEIQVRNSLSRLDAVINNAPAGLLVEDPDRKLVLCNQQLCDIFGLPDPELLVGADCAAAAEQTAELFAEPTAFLRGIQATLDAGEAVYGTPLAMDDGRTLERDYVPIPNADDGFGHLWVYRDVTEQQEVLNDLRAAKAAADAANAAKSQFLSRVSHELRTPLNAVLGFAQVLLRSQGDPLTAGQRLRVEQIAQAGNHLLGLIDDLMDISRIEGAELNLVFEEHDPNHLVSDAVALLKEKAAVGGVAITMHLDAERANVDQQRFRQIVVNLVSNAIKYNRPGGSVSVDLRTAGEHLQLIVEDTGVGIAEERLAELFEPFERLGADKTTIEGTGIGLAITRALIQMMGGDIVLTSEEGVGTTFVVRLPQRGVTNHDHQGAKQS